MRLSAQPYASRKGCATRSSPTANGRSAVAPADWTPVSGPLSSERNDIEMRTSDASTSRPMTSRRRSGPVDREGTVVEIRRTVRPSAADRALRCRDMARQCSQAPRRFQVWGPPSRRRNLGAQQAVAAGGAVAARAVDDLELLEASSRADRDARQRALGEVHGDLRLVAYTLVEPLQERTASG